MIDARMLFTFYTTPKEMIKKDKNGITACSLANCCLTLREQTDPTQLTFSNEKGEELTCSKDEFKEMSDYLHREGILEHNPNFQLGVPTMSSLPTSPIGLAEGTIWQDVKGLFHMV